MRRILVWAIFMALTGLLGTAQADVVVDTASGTIGGITMTNVGINGSGTATISITMLPNTQSFLNNVNGVTVVPDPAEVQGPVTLLVTPTGLGTYSLGLVPPTYEVVFGTTPGAQGILDFNQKTGVAPLALPTFFNMSGSITSLISNLDPMYDFSHMPGGGMNFAITGTTFTGTKNFAGLFSTPGAAITGSGSFSMSSIPEPTPMVTLGMGMSVVFAGMAFRKCKQKILKTS